MKNQVRVIAGEWRGRKISFPNVSGLRPTPDRVRETLFNWLNRSIAYTRCLDLFAGSGALGFEAASRDAACVLLVESNKRAFQYLCENIERFGASNKIKAKRMDVSKFLKYPSQPFDLVFLDPPFGHGFIERNCFALENNGWLTDKAKIYIETDRSEPMSELPKSWQEIKRKTAGTVSYYLFERDTLTRNGNQ